MSNQWSVYKHTSQAISHACTGRTRTCCGMVWNEEKRPELMDIPSRLAKEKK
jgi:hypothetical protein